MARKLMLLLAFLAVFGQALAGASFRGTGSGELGHVLAHAQEDGHRHHDDGGMQGENADEAAFHVHLDGANPAALPVALCARVVPSIPQGPPGWEPPAHSSPTMDSLLRPPKAPSCA